MARIKKYPLLIATILSAVVTLVRASPSASADADPTPSRLLQEQQQAEAGSLLQLEEDVWGPVVEERSDREKRLFKPKSAGIGASIGAKVGKQVASKAFNSVKQGVVKKVLSVSALSSGQASSTGLKVAKNVGTKAAKAAAVVGIKTLLLNLVFGKINQLIEWKTRLLDNLEKQNRAKNQQFLNGGVKPTTTTTDAGVIYGYTGSPGGYYTSGAEAEHPEPQEPSYTAGYTPGYSPSPSGAQDSTFGYMYSPSTPQGPTSPQYYYQQR